MTHLSKMSFGIFIATLFLLTGCAEDDRVLISLDQYLTEKSITPLEHSSGLKYVITEAGSGPSPTLSDDVTVKYTGKLTDGSVFDSSNENTRTFPLDGLIEGWKIGFQLLKKGSKATLYVPSNLGYGSRGSAGGAVPPNADLIFDVELVDFK